MLQGGGGQVEWLSGPIATPLGAETFETHYTTGLVFRTMPYPEQYPNCTDYLILQGFVESTSPIAPPLE